MHTHWEHAASFSDSLISHLTLSYPFSVCVCWDGWWQGGCQGEGSTAVVTVEALPPPPSSPTAYPLTSTMVTSPQLVFPLTSPVAKDPIETDACFGRLLHTTNVAFFPCNCLLH